MALCGLVGDYRCYAGTSVSSYKYIGNCARHCAVSKIFILTVRNPPKCYYYTCNLLFNISFSSHQMVLFRINTSADSDGREEKDPINLTNQFTDFELTVIRNVTPCSFADGYL